MRIYHKHFNASKFWRVLENCTSFDEEFKYVKNYSLEFVCLGFLYKWIIAYKVQGYEKLMYQKHNKHKQRKV